MSAPIDSEFLSGLVSPTPLSPLEEFQRRRALHLSGASPMEQLAAAREWEESQGNIPGQDVAPPALPGSPRAEHERRLAAQAAGVPPIEELRARSAAQADMMALAEQRERLRVAEEMEALRLAEEASMANRQRFAQFQSPPAQTPLQQGVQSVLGQLPSGPGVVFDNSPVLSLPEPGGSDRRSTIRRMRAPAPAAATPLPPAPAVVVDQQVISPTVQYEPVPGVDLPITETPIDLASEPILPQYIDMPYFRETIEPGRSVMPQIRVSQSSDDFIPNTQGPSGAMVTPESVRGMFDFGTVRDLVSQWRNPYGRTGSYRDEYLYPRQAGITVPFGIVGGTVLHGGDGSVPTPAPPGAPVVDPGDGQFGVVNAPVEGFVGVGGIDPHSTVTQAPDYLMARSLWESEGIIPEGGFRSAFPDAEFEMMALRRPEGGNVWDERIIEIPQGFLGGGGTFHYQPATTRGLSNPRSTSERNAAAQENVRTIPAVWNQVQLPSGEFEGATTADGNPLNYTTQMFPSSFDGRSVPDYASGFTGEDATSIYDSIWESAPTVGGAGYATLPVFDEAAYLAANPGLEAGIEAARIASPTEHYWRHGVTEGREGFFEGNPFVITQPGFGIGESGGEGMNRGGLVRGLSGGGLG